MFRLSYNGEIIGQVVAAKIDDNAHLRVRALNVAAGNMENFTSTRVVDVVFVDNNVVVNTRSGSSYVFTRMCENHGKSEWQNAKEDAIKLCEKLAWQIPWWAAA